MQKSLGQHIPWFLSFLPCYLILCLGSTTGTKYFVLARLPSVAQSTDLCKRAAAIDLLCDSAGFFLTFSNPAPHILVQHLIDLVI